MKTTAPNSDNLEGSSEKRIQDSSFSLPISHISPHPPTLVPKVRFPEFRGAWEKKTLETLGYFTGGGTPSKDNTAYWTGEIPWISSSDLNEDSISQINITRFITKQAVQESATKLVPAISILLISRVGVGKLAVSTFPLCTSQDFTNFTPTDADPLFLAYLLKSQKETLLSFNQGTSIKGFTKDNIASLRLGFPSPAEQQKIADCLSSVDDLIAAQARKVAALKTHKKGLMQQLFPREGETQPRLRFPEFQNAKEWEEVALGDIAEIKLGKMLDKQKNTTGHLLPYLNNLAVRWNEVNTSDLPKMYFNDRELDRFGLKVGDVVVCEGGEPGRAAVWDGRLPDLKFQKAIHRVRFYEPFEPKILVLHLENLAGTTEFEMLFTGGGIKHLTGETFSRLKVPLIPHAEQKRIASCLSSLDALISAETQKYETLKTHKKGLMQQLFPSPEEALP